jgi:hypothetical protein
MRQALSAVAAMAVVTGGVARAATLTVGPTGAYPTVQAAVTHASSMAGVHYVRVARGTFAERIVVPRFCCGGSVGISGGWNTSFTAQTADPSLTVIDGGGAGRTLSAPQLESGTLTISNLTIQRGRLRVGAGGSAAGAGINASVSGGAGLWLRDVHVRLNTITAEKTGTAEALGAGAFVLVQDWSRFLAERCVFEQNSTVESGSARLTTRGAGLNVQLFDGGSAVRDTRFVRNTASGSEFATGGGLSVLVQYVGTLGFTVEDSLFEDNTVAGSSGASGADLWTGDGIGATTLLARRNRFLGNRGGRAQVVASSTRSGRVDVADSLMAQGDRGGADAFASNGGAAHLTNLTVADNDGLGVRARSVGADVSVFNTIAFANTAGDLRLELSAYSGANLVGVDPRFVDPAAGNYRPSITSPVIDAGNATAPGGLGPLDLDKRPRVQRSTVDIGAYEVPLIIG